MADSVPLWRSQAWSRFRQDLRRYLRPGEELTVRSAAFAFRHAESLWAIAIYRAGQYLHEEAPGWVARLFRVPYAATHRTMRFALGIHLFPQTRIGPGLYIGHYGGIWISPLAELGAQCIINHETTIGTATDRGAPKLGDRVWVGPNVTVTGNVELGDGAVVAANSLVVANVPPRGVVVGVPAKLMSMSGSEKLMQPQHLSAPRAARQ